MDVAPKTLLFFFTHTHSLHFFYLFNYFLITMLNVHCNFSYFLLCGMLLYSVVSRCKTLPLYFYFYFLFSSSFLCFATLILISQTLFDLCTLQKPLRENPNILVFLLVLPPMQKILFSSLGFTQFFLLSPYKRILGPKPLNSSLHCLFIGLNFSFFTNKKYIISLTMNIYFHFTLRNIIFFQTK